MRAKEKTRRSSIVGKRCVTKVDGQGWAEISRTHHGIMVKGDVLYVLESVSRTRLIGKEVHIRSEIEVADAIYPQDLARDRRDLFRLVSTVSQGVGWLEEAVLQDETMRANAKKRGRK